MPENPFEEAGREFKRALEEHARRMHEEIERARRQVRDVMDRAKADIERETAEFNTLMAEIRRQKGRLSDWNSPDDWMPQPRRPRRPPRKPRGGEPAFVTPRPKPKPLVDGAEAPIE